MSEIVKVSRRDFLATSALVGGGLILGFYLPGHDIAIAAKSPAAPFAPNAFIRVGHDGVVTFIINHSEMGQGVYTSLPMLIAEELECDWQKVRVEEAPVDPAYNNPAFGMQGTGGSTSTWTEWDRFPKAGATAREMLIAAAAKGWKVDPATCRAENGRVIHKGGKSIGYGELVDKASENAGPQGSGAQEPGSLQDRRQARHRLDSPAKINGTAEFGLDVRFPGMLTAVVAHPPVFGGKVKSFNADKARAIPGVKEVVQIPSGVAVVATGFPAAQKGRAALEIVWDEGEWARLNTPEMVKEYALMAATPGLMARKDGDPDQAYGAVRPETHGRVQRSLPRPCDHGTAQLRRRSAQGRLRHLDRHPGANR